APLEDDALVDLQARGGDVPLDPPGLQDLDRPLRPDVPDHRALDDDLADVDLGLHPGALAHDQNVVGEHLTPPGDVDPDGALEGELALELAPAAEERVDLPDHRLAPRWLRHCKMPPLLVVFDAPGYHRRRSWSRPGRVVACDPVTPPVYIVSGLPRSGTSMMMRMLAAGGLPVLTDEVREADSDNPRGYFELEAVKGSAKDASWVRQAPGKAVKVISYLLRSLPADLEYRVVFMRRSLDQVVRS